MNIVFMSMDTLPSTLWARDLYDQMQFCWSSGKIMLRTSTRGRILS